MYQYYVNGQQTFNTPWMLSVFLYLHYFDLEFSFLQHFCLYGIISWRPLTNVDLQLHHLHLKLNLKTFCFVRKITNCRLCLLNVYWDLLSITWRFLKNQLDGIIWYMMSFNKRSIDGSCVSLLHSSKHHNLGVRANVIKEAFCNQSWL